MSATSTMTAAGPIALDVPFADVTAADLRLSIGGAVPPMLAHLTIAPHPDAPAGSPTLTLGILGSSHVAYVGDAAAPAHVEELSCTAIGGVALHAVDPAERGTGVHVDRLDVAGFGSVVKQVRSVGEDPSALVAEFPGCDGAITAVHGEALPGGHRWRTWHLYPDARGGGEVVSTSSSWRMGATR